MSDFATGAARIFAAHDLAALDEAAAGGAFPSDLWRALEEAGFTRACVSEAHGGAGLPLTEGFAIIAEAGRVALPAPLTETLIAGWLLDQAGLMAPDGPLSVAEPGASRVAFGATVPHVAALVEGEVRLARPTAATPRALDEDMAADVELETAQAAKAPQWLGPDQWRGLGAAARAAQMAGACEAALALTLDYTQGREQFGRPLSNFQAIQHHLADMAGEAAAAVAASSAAARAIEADPHLGPDTLNDIATAKIRAGQAATRVASLAHQCHGAMGFTREYSLGRYTRRLWRWRDEFGAEPFWSRRLGASILQNGPLWPQVT